MRRKIYILLYSVLAAVIATGCSGYMVCPDSSDDWFVKMPMPIEFDIAYMTKDLINNPENLVGKKFGVFGIKSGEFSNDNLYLDNVSATCFRSNDEVKFRLVDEHYYEEDSDDLLTFYSYHPFTQQIYSTPDDELNSDDVYFPQFSDDGTELFVYLTLGENDILYAQADGQYNANTVLNNGNPTFNFRHLTSGIKFTLDKTDAPEFEMLQLELHAIPYVVSLCVFDADGDNEGQLTWLKRINRYPVNFDEVIFLYPTTEYISYVLIDGNRYPITVSPPEALGTNQEEEINELPEYLKSHIPGYIYQYKIIIGKDLDGKPTVKLAPNN